MSSFPPLSQPKRRSYSTDSILQENTIQVKTKVIRSTKNTEKLVLFPAVQTTKVIQTVNVFTPETLNDNQMTDAEKMSKENRKYYPRVSSYCIADGLKLDEISRYVLF